MRMTKLEKRQAGYGHDDNDDAVPGDYIGGLAEPLGADPDKQGCAEKAMEMTAEAFHYVGAKCTGYEVLTTVGFDEIWEARTPIAEGPGDPARSFTFTPPETDRVVRKTVPALFVDLDGGDVVNMRKIVRDRIEGGDDLKRNTRAY